MHLHMWLVDTELPLGESCLLALFGVMEVGRNKFTSQGEYQELMTFPDPPHIHLPPPLDEGKQAQQAGKMLLFPASF